MVNILVVEDDRKLNKAVCTYLNDSGFRRKAVKMSETRMMKCISIGMN